MKSKTIISALVLLVLVGGASYWYWYSNQKPVNNSNSEVIVPPQEKEKISFRVQVTNAGLQARWLNNGKQLTDFIETKLLGQLNNPPLRFIPIEKAYADLETPVQAAISDFSAFKADDDEWIVSNFIPAEKNEINSFLQDKELREKNKDLFIGRKYLYVTGQVEYGNFTLVFVRYDEQGTPRPLTFEKIGSEWKRTNKLSDDETFDIVFSALANGEVRVIK